MPAKILILSKHENIRESLKLILSDAHELILCDTDEQCLGVLKNALVRLVLLGLSNADSLSIIEKIAQQNIKMIAVTLHKAEAKGQEAVRLGAKGYITMPIKSEELLALCR